MARKTNLWFLTAATAALILAGQAGRGSRAAPSDARSPRTPPSARLYVIDCGTLHIADMGRFQLRKEEVASTDLSVACFLVVHPKGTLMWDTGAVPDAAWKPSGSPVTQHIVLPDAQQRDLILFKSL